MLPQNPRFQQNMSLILGMEIKQEFVELRAKGWSYTRIARRLKVSKSTLSNWRGELDSKGATILIALLFVWLPFWS